MYQDAKPDDLQHLRQLAAALDCFTEEEHLLLSGWSADTAKSKRKRGEGPPYVLHGKNYLYPRAEYQEYLKRKVRETRGLSGKEAL